MTLETASTITILAAPEAAPNIDSANIHPNFVAYVGIDWADRKHDIALYDCATGTWEESIIQSQPQDILDWVNTLRSRYGNQQIVRQRQLRLTKCAKL